MKKDRVQERRDLFGPNAYELVPFLGKKGSRFALILPGGGYRMVSSHVEGKPFALALNRSGYSAFVLRYRVRREGEYPAPLEDVARALRFILNNAAALGVDTEGWSLWGSSAGGHLAACFGTETMGYARYGLPRPAALVLVYPVITADPATCHKGSIKRLLGGRLTPERREMISAEKHIDPDFPPTYLWCSRTDRCVDWHNSLVMAKALEAAGVPCRFRLFDTGSHGVGLARELPADGWFEEAVAFWEAHLPVAAAEKRIASC